MKLVALKKIRWSYNGTVRPAKEFNTGQVFNTDDKNASMMLEAGLAKKYSKDDLEKARRQMEELQKGEKSDKENDKNYPADTEPKIDDKSISEAKNKKPVNNKKNK